MNVYSASQVESYHLEEVDVTHLSSLHLSTHVTKCTKLFYAIILVE